MVTTAVGALALLAGGSAVYARWRFDQIPKQHVGDLTPRVANQPFDLLLVGADSPAFVDTTAVAPPPGNPSSTGVLSSEVIIIARVVPQAHKVELLFIPSDVYLDIPGKIPGVSGPNPIAAAFGGGPTLFARTIEQTFHLPLNDYAEVKLPGLAPIVDALGGVDLDFADPIHDTYSGLTTTRTGCQAVDGAQALALVRSSNLLYYSAPARSWENDYGSEPSSIQRQDALLRALLPKLRGVLWSPGGLNSVLAATTRDITVDNTFSESALFDLAELFRGLGRSGLTTETLPTVAYATPTGADVLLPAAGPDEQMIREFLVFGVAHTGAHDGLAGTVTTIAPSPRGAAVIYNSVPETWNPEPCGD